MRGRTRIAAVAAGAMGLAGVGIATAPAASADAAGCGGSYPAALELQPGGGLSFCSDGLLEGVGVPTGDPWTSTCGGTGALVTLETQPVGGVSWCSDGILP